VILTKKQAYPQEHTLMSISVTSASKSFAMNVQARMEEKNARNVRLVAIQQQVRFTYSKKLF
jgi:hypothetical protein